MAQPLLILGRRPGPAADSAQRAGFDPIPIPFAGDARAALHELQAQPTQAPVLIAGDLENHPKLLDAIAFDRDLIGCSPDAVRSVRSPGALADLPAIPGIRFLETRGGAALGLRLKRLALGLFSRRRYLRKPVASYHGQGIAWWTPATPVGHDGYLQQYARGLPLSAVFKADGWSAILVGVTEQLVGEPAFGAPDFAWCGAVGPVQLGEKSRHALNQLAVALTQRHDLRGVFGIDFIQDFRGRLCPVEVNPRYPESTDLLERATRSAALLRGVAPVSSSSAKHRRSHAPQLLGQALLHAEADAPCPDLNGCLPADALLNVPDPAARLVAAQPFARLQAAGPNRDAIVKQLQAMAREVYARIAPPKREVLTETTPRLPPPPKRGIETVEVKRIPRPDPDRKQLE